MCKRAFKAQSHKIRFLTNPDLTFMRFLSLPFFRNFCFVPQLPSPKSLFPFPEVPASVAWDLLPSDVYLGGNRPTTSGISAVRSQFAFCWRLPKCTQAPSPHGVFAPSRNQRQSIGILFKRQIFTQKWWMRSDLRPESPRENKNANDAKVPIFSAKTGKNDTSFLQDILPFYSTCNVPCQTAKIASEPLDCSRLRELLQRMKQKTVRFCGNTVWKLSMKFFNHFKSSASLLVPPPSSFLSQRIVPLFVRTVGYLYRVASPN